MHLHYLEKKYGIRINLFDWSGDDYETGTLNALIKIESTDVGRILLESIAYHIRHNPGNVLNGILEVRPYAEGDCNGSTAPETTTKRGRLIKPVVHFWPKAYAKGGACSKYLDDHIQETGVRSHGIVHIFPEFGFDLPPGRKILPRKSGVHQEPGRGESFV